MPFKPVGVDDKGNLPPRVMKNLAATFVTRPGKPGDGQVLTWNAATNSWLAVSLGSDKAPITVIDGGTPNG